MHGPDGGIVGPLDGVNELLLEFVDNDVSPSKLGAPKLAVAK